MLKTILCLFVGIVVVLIMLMLFSICDYVGSKESSSDEGFPYIGNTINNSTNWFYNFDVFKKIVYEFAEKDEEIKKYLHSRKKGDSTSIQSGREDRKENS